MKRNILTLTFLACLLGSLSLQAQNPYKSLGVEMETLTLSKGKYLEFFPNDSLVQIGTVIFDTRNKAIVGFVIRDTTYYEANLEPEVSSRFLQTDPYAAMYPNVSPYTYALNNPLIYIDPDGKQVRCTTRDDCQAAADDINETHEGAGVEVLEKTRDKKIFGIKYGEETYYELSTGAEDYDWGADEYSSALYDVLASEENIFQVTYSEEIGRSSTSNNKYDGQEWGGGKFKPNANGKGADIQVDPRGNQRTGEPSSVILMHELVGHTHPVATPLGPGNNNAHDINRHYMNKLGIVPKAGHQNPHRGYKGEVKWKKVNLYKNQ